MTGRPPENPLDEVQWVDQYRPSEDTELQRTADQILGSVDDPTFSGSEVGPLHLLFRFYELW